MRESFDSTSTWYSQQATPHFTFYLLLVNFLNQYLPHMLYILCFILCILYIFHIRIWQREKTGYCADNIVERTPYWVPAFIRLASAIGTLHLLGSCALHTAHCAWHNLVSTRTATDILLPNNRLIPADFMQAKKLYQSRILHGGMLMVLAETHRKIS